MRDLSSLMRGEPMAPLHWECRVLITGLPGNSLPVAFKLFKGPGDTTKKSEIYITWENISAEFLEL